MNVYLYNSLTHKKERFNSLKKNEVGIYSCGPTVYWNQHIGHMYAYAQWDILVRTFRYLGFKTKWVVNLTDVGHMTSDEDAGVDKMEKGAKREGVSVWEIAEKYIEQFKDSMKLMNITTPDILCRATENIPEQINLAKTIQRRGFAYLTKKGLVFDTAKFKDYAKFGNLNLSEMKSRGDIEIDKDKKLPWDFFLWVKDASHLMKWQSPWGEGYPGWHLECTAMSTKYLGNNFDIHTGGMEHIKVHHTNEIAQGFASFGHQTANYWLHNGWLVGKNGEKMSKSLGNYVTIQDLAEKGYDPLSLRYLILTSHYKKGLKFSLKSLDSAQKALDNLRNLVDASRNDHRRTSLSEEKNEKVIIFREKFMSLLSDDINISRALAVTWEMMKSNIPNYDKYDLILDFDQVLGLELNRLSKAQRESEVPDEIKELIINRKKLREEKKYDEADKLREKINKLGFNITD